ncbi:MAG: hypothetical protein JSU01_13960 [Bacteroidetes bacterium]|nr:hypothetical protein [Bacteroidota bacterium]
MKFLLFCLVCLMFLSCNNVHSTKSNTISSIKISNKPFQKRSFNLDSLESSKTLYDSLKNLPKLESHFLKLIIPKLNDSSVAENMLKDPHYTFIRKFGQININGNNGILLVRVTDYNSVSGKIYLLVMDKSGKIIAKADLAQYYDEAGSSTYLSSVQISPNEFQQVVSGSDIKQSDKPDSLGVYENIGREEYKVDQKMKFQNGRFVTTIIDTASRLVK